MSNINITNINVTNISEDITICFNIPEILPNKQSWLWCPLILDSLHDDNIKVKYNINFNKLNKKLQEIFYNSSYESIKSKIKEYLNKNDINNYNDYHNKYIKPYNDKWWHINEKLQEEILNNSNVRPEVEYLTILIVEIY